MKTTIPPLRLPYGEWVKAIPLEKLKARLRIAKGMMEEAMKEYEQIKTTYND
jgi:hypothetical protein